MSKENHPNYQYLVSKARGKTLDFGCGKGDIVRMALKSDLDAYGVEYFGPGSGTNIREVLTERGLLGDRVHEYDGVKLPFEDDTFDTVLSNQVLEHVPDVDHALSEVSRVLKPGGTFVCTFPYQDAFREGHSNTLFSHWVPKGPTRYWILWAHRIVGIGRLKRNRDISTWASFFNEWIEDNTFYLTGREVTKSFERHFSSHEHNERDYMKFRYGNFPLSSFICRRFGSLVIAARK